MKLDLSCPIELRGYTLSYTADAVLADMRLYNLSRRRIASFEGVSKWRSSVAERAVAAPFVAERLRAAGESMFSFSLDHSHLPDADSLEILFTCVRYEDGLDEWRAGDGPFAELRPLPAIAPEDLTLLRASAGSDAVCFPSVDENCLRCVCGRVNERSGDVCVRCHRDLGEVVRYTPEAVRESALPDNPPESDALEERCPQRQKRRFRSALALALAVLALAGCAALQFFPESASVPRAEAAASTEK